VQCKQEKITTKCTHKKIQILQHMGYYNFGTVSFPQSVGMAVIFCLPS